MSINIHSKLYDYDVLNRTDYLCTIINEYFIVAVVTFGIILVIVNYQVFAE